MFFIVVFLSCKKKHTDPPPNSQPSPCPYPAFVYIPFDSNLTQLEFKKNSFWVYVDSVLLAVDSSYVDSVLYDDEVKIQSCADVKIKRYSFRVKNLLPPLQESFLLYNRTGESRNGSAPNNVNNAIYVSFSSLASYTNSFSAGDTISKKDSMFIYDRYYKQVVICNWHSDVNEGNLKTIYYSNSDYGLLRKDVFDSNGTLKSRRLLKNKNVIR